MTTHYLKDEPNFTPTEGKPSLTPFEGIYIEFDSDEEYNTKMDELKVANEQMLKTFFNL